MRRLIGLLMPVILFFIILSCKSNSESRLLKFNLEKGKSYDYEMVMNMDQEVMDQKNKIGFTAGYTINVVDDNGTVKTLDVAYKDFKMNMSMMGQEIDIDASQKPDIISSNSDDPMQMMKNVFSGIIGKKFTMKVTPSGKIEEITGFTEIIKSMVDSISANGEAKDMMSKSVKDQFNPERIKEAFAPMFSVYPNKEVSVGDKWSNSYDLSPQGIKINLEYTVKSFSGDNAILGVNSKIIPLEGNEDPALAGIKMSGTQTGTMTVNTRTGLVVEGELDQNLETSGSMKMKMISKTKMRGTERS